MKLYNKIELNKILAQDENKLESLLRNEPEAFYCIQEAQLRIEYDRRKLHLLDTQGLKLSVGVVPFFEDDQGNLYKGDTKHGTYSKCTVTLKDGTKVRLTGHPIYTPKQGLHEVFRNIPVDYQLVTDSSLNPKIRTIEVSTNMVTGEKNPFWNM